LPFTFDAEEGLDTLIAKVKALIQRIPAANYEEEDDRGQLSGEPIAQMEEFHESAQRSPSQFFL
jgi:hypothetical protein